MAKEPQHGGKRPGAGRPSVPADERRDLTFGFKISAAEKRLLDDADAKLWARPMIFAAAEKKLAELGRKKKPKKT